VYGGVLKKDRLLELEDISKEKILWYWHQHPSLSGTEIATFLGIEPMRLIDFLKDENQTEFKRGDDDRLYAKGFVFELFNKIKIRFKSINFPWSNEHTSKAISGAILTAIFAIVANALKEILTNSNFSEGFGPNHRYDYSDIFEETHYDDLGIPDELWTR
jgi:hypothetical protein